MAKSQPWSDDEIRLLKLLHSNGRTARKIADALYNAGFPPRTRNAVIGQLQRAGLSQARKRHTKQQTRGLISVAGSAKHCQWPHGDPKDSDFRYCGASVTPGRPYCAEHMAIAYVQKGQDHRWRGPEAAE